MSNRTLGKKCFYNTVLHTFVDNACRDVSSQKKRMFYMFLALFVNFVVTFIPWLCSDGNVTTPATNRNMPSEVMSMLILAVKRRI